MRKSFFWGTGSVLTFIFLLLICSYVLRESKRAVQPVLYPEEPDNKATLEGYEDENELIGYMMYQFQNGNLDYALRGCASQNISEYFLLEDYAKYTLQFPGMRLIPPADTDGKAYIAVSNARLTVSYTAMLEALMDYLGTETKLELISVEDGTPEDADGKYYQRIETFCTILGARSLSEKIIYLRADSDTLKIHCTLIRHKRYWKVLFFHSLEDMPVTFLDIQRETYATEQLPVSLERYAQDILPCNYYILNNCSEEDPETLIERFFLYLQRGDGLSAMSYYNIYEKEDEISISTAFFERQKRCAMEIQEFYYRVLLYDTEQQTWIMRNLEDSSGDLVRNLAIENMLFSKLNQIEEVRNDGDSAEYDVYFSYSGYDFHIKMFLIYKNGWKLEDITWV